jgi:anaerobic magnesium-protoporphyrin IX monomethyl ester cyclase
VEKVLVINPNYRNVKDKVKYRPRQPLSLLYIVSILEQEAGCRVSFYDLNHENINLNVAKEYDTLITTTTPLDRWETPYYNYSSVLKLIEVIKEENSSITAVLTGVHGTVTPELLFGESEKLDIIVRGEPEDTVRSLAVKQIDTVKGISYRQGNQVVHNENRDKPVDLDLLPFPAYDRIDFSRYEYKDSALLPQPFSIIESSRGCPFKCIFCNKVMHGNRYRCRSAESILAEQDLLQKKYGVRSVYFQDLEFTIKRDRVIELCCEMMAKDINLAWGCAARCTDVDRELLLTMKEAGCRFISFGVESLHDQILKVINKNIAFEDIKRAKRLCEEVGLKFNSFTLIGFPGETKKTVAISLLRSILFGINYKLKKAKVRPYPGTELYEMAVSEGLVDKNTNPWVELNSIEGTVGNKGNYDQGLLIKLLAGLQNKMQLKRKYR